MTTMSSLILSFPLLLCISTIAFTTLAKSEDDCSSTEKSNDVEELKKLIDDAYKDAKDYNQRQNNKDFFKEVDKAKSPEDFGTWDFVIVGGGSAGSVVANRLSEIEPWKVLVIEAGPINDKLSDVPYFNNLLAISDRNWGYNTTPQAKACFARNDRKCPYVRGKILGGSGTLNALVYARGQKADYDNWESLGNTGWSYDDVLQYYKKLENYVIDPSNPLNGHNGPMFENFVEPISKYNHAYYEANEALGLNYTENYNDGHFKVGVARMVRNIKDGRRESGANNYIQTVWNDRKGIRVMLESYATKILIDPHTKRATGVLFVNNGTLYNVTCSKEVILSGGSINSAQLLMLSGIGPKKELQKHKIDLIKDLPVGQYVKDHSSALMYFTWDHMEESKSDETLIEEFNKGRGLYTDAFNMKAVTFFATEGASASVPNIEIAFSPPISQKSTPPDNTNYKPEITKRFEELDQRKAWWVQVFNLHPKSVGKLTLQSADPADFPLIDSNIFDDEDDINVLLKGVDFILKVSNSSIFKEYNSTFFELPLSDCVDFDKFSHKYWKCYVQSMGFASYHISSTCKMGPSNDTLAVVNPDLQVYGFENLRVIDVSIMPTTVSGHTNAQAFMIGEKGADLIKKKYV